ncbi:MAG: hypothetical protein ACK5UZ_07915 [Pseudanabaena sp.]
MAKLAGYICVTLGVIVSVPLRGKYRGEGGYSLGELKQDGLKSFRPLAG